MRRIHCALALGLLAFAPACFSFECPALAPPTAGRILNIPTLDLTAQSEAWVTLHVRQDIRDPQNVLADRLCYVSDDTGAGLANPVLRVRQGQRLNVTLTNDIGVPDRTAQFQSIGAADAGASPSTTSAPASSAPAPASPTPMMAAPSTATSPPSGPPLTLVQGMAMPGEGITNLHTHGFHVPPTQDTAIVPCLSSKAPPPAGCTRSYAYSYDIPLDQPPGLDWYHPHRHGESQPQVMLGLTGAIVITPQPGTESRYGEAAALPDTVLVVRDHWNVVTSPSGTAVVAPATRAIAARESQRRFGAGGSPDLNKAPLGDPRVDAALGPQIVACTPGSTTSQRTVISVNNQLLRDGLDTATAPTLSIERRTLVRLLNSSANTYVLPRLRLSDSTGVRQHAIPMLVLARDGNPVGEPFGTTNPRYFSPENAFLVPPAGRLEFIVDPPGRGQRLFLDSDAVPTGCAGDGVPARRIAEIRSTGDNPPLIEAGTLPGAAAVSESQRVAAPAVAPKLIRRFAFSEASRGNTDETEFYITQVANQIPGQPEQLLPATITPFCMPGMNEMPGMPCTPQETVVTLDRDEAVRYEDWIVENYTNELHAFHIHQMAFQVLQVDGDVAIGGSDVGARLDTVNVPAAKENADGTPGAPGRVRLRLAFKPYMAGTDFVFHCHLLEHEDNGMMGLIKVQLASP
jgi:FtsP/CotA-like multicopper oxidase with cupredoxin domain